MGGVFGLNYAVVLEVAKAMNISVDVKFIRLLKAFETVVVEELNKEFNKNKEHK